MKNMTTIVLLLLAAPLAQAQFTFSSVTQDDMTEVTKEMSHNFMFSSVSGASSLGKIWGFELGVTGGTADGERISQIIKRTSPNTDFKNLYHAGILARVSVPAGLMLEANYLPKLEQKNAELSSVGGALKYTIMELPVALALRGHYSKSDFTFTQSSGSFTGTIDYDTTVYGAQAIVSQKFVFIEPYIGGGFVKGKGDLKATGTGTLFSFTSSQTASAEESSAQLMGGLNFHFGFFHLGAEYSRAFDTDRIAGKLSFGF